MHGGGYLVAEKIIHKEKLKEFKLKFPGIPVCALKEDTNILFNTNRRDMEELMSECNTALKIENAYDFSDRIEDRKSVV